MPSLTTPTVSARSSSIRLAAAATLVAAAALGSGCNNAGQGAFTGAGLGAAGGAIIGSMYGHAGTGAAIGAVSGALTGGVIGDQNARNAHRPTYVTQHHHHYTTYDSGYHPRPYSTQHRTYEFYGY